MPSINTVNFAVNAVAQYSLSFWDAMLWSVARENAVSKLYSEDFQSGRIIQGVKSINPFEWQPIQMGDGAFPAITSHQGLARKPQSGPSARLWQLDSHQMRENSNGTISVPHPINTGVEGYSAYENQGIRFSIVHYRDPETQHHHRFVTTTPCVDQSGNDRHTVL